MRFPSIVTMVVSTIILAGYTHLSEAAVIFRLPPPNILFVIMDDVGIDQMPSFGYGGGTAAPMPNMDQIAKAGIRFRNNWSMPACSPSRAMFFQGRFPTRTNIFNALGQVDLANSMVSSYDITTPKLLKKRNYQSGLFGKFHVALPGNDPYSFSMVSALGWDYFYGFSDDTGDPQSIDKTAGGAGGTTGNGKAYTCGFVPGAKYDGGADKGACYAADNSCENMTTTTQLNPAGRICRDNGGIFLPKQSCKKPTPSNVNFSVMNGHYVSPMIIDNKGKVTQLLSTDLRARTYRSSGPVDAAIKWINKAKSTNKPWMATVGFPADHTPLQQPPYDLLSANSQSLDTNGYDCTSNSNQSTLSNQMIEAMDTKIGQLLVETHLATTNADGSLNYQPEKTNTMVIIVGDNGSLGTVIKTPFDATRAKGTPYQSGVWVPLIVAGPLVNQPDRNVEHMTNIADLYQLFGEIAGIDVHKSVPWHIDSVAMLPYLKSPNKSSIRNFNFNQIDINLQANGTINGPCIAFGSCTNIPPSQSVCQDNGGVWWGEGAVDSDDPNNLGPVPKTQCCDVAIWEHDNGGVIPRISSQASLAIRNTKYKNVRTYTKDYDASKNACVDKQTNELYKIDQASPTPTLDKSGSDLLVNGFDALTAEQKRNYNALNYKLSELLNNVTQCDGDGNLDGVVNQKDISGWEKFNAKSGKTTPNGGGLSSWYDFDLNGVTDNADYQIIMDNLGKHCKSSNANHPNGTNLDWVTK
ncbi:MAG: hypothetical protein RLZ75_1428 [Pseudomonadota bacterium]